MSDTISSSSDDWDLVGDSDRYCAESASADQNLNCVIDSIDVLNKSSDDFDGYSTSVSSARESISNSDDGNVTIKQVKETDCCVTRNELAHYDSDTSKMRCYKHNRNEKINNVLNLILVLEVASVFGLGAGHFLAWSQNCKCSADEYKMVSVCKDSYEMLKGNIHMPRRKLVPDEIYSARLMSVGSKDESNVLSTSLVKNDHAVRNICFGLTQDDNILISHESVDKSPFLQNACEMKPAVMKPNASVLVNEYLADSYLISQNSKQELSSVIISINESDDSQILKENGESDTWKKLDLDLQHLIANGVVNRIGKDFGQIIQSLSATAIAYVSKLDVDAAILKDKVEFMTNIYNDFRMDIGKKLSDIENFMRNPLYEKSKKSNAKALKKMVLFLVNSVDDFLKINLKTLKMDMAQINIEKFGKRLSKSLKYMNKNWGKIKDMRQTNSENVHHGSHKSFKKTEKWKKKIYFRKESHKKNYHHKSDKLVMKA